VEPRVITTVTFDFWETLVRDTPDNLRRQRALRVEALARVLARAGQARSAAAVDEGYERSQAVLVERYWGRQRDLSRREQVRLVLDCVVPGVADRLAEALLEEAVEGYIRPVLAHPPGLSPGAGEAVRGLAARGIRLGIVSNTGRTPGVVLRQVLQSHDLLRHFTAIAYSDEVGYRKPDPRIFHASLAQAGSRPAEAVHVGDNPVDDVAGARAAGMRAVHYAAGGREGAAEADAVVTDLADLPGRLPLGD
jgi:putative hydrolase of the HAD superfamily